MTSFHCYGKVEEMQRCVQNLRRYDRPILCTEYMARPRGCQTNKAIMGDQVLSPAAAWKKLQQFLALPEVNCLAEPPGLDERLGDFCNLGRTSPNLWTDAYLAAFARCAGLRLVTFDQGFSRFKGLELLILKPEG